MYPDLFLEETPYGSILVNDYLPYAATQYLHFSWSLMGGSTVFSRKVLIEDTIFYYPVKTPISPCSLPRGMFCQAG